MPAQLTCWLKLVKAISPAAITSVNLLPIFLTVRLLVTCLQAKRINHRVNRSAVPIRTAAVDSSKWTPSRTWFKIKRIQIRMAAPPPCLILDRAKSWRLMRIHQRTVPRYPSIKLTRLTVERATPIMPQGKRWSPTSRTRSVGCLTIRQTCQWSSISPPSL